MIFEKMIIDFKWDSVDFGTYLKTAREELRVTQEELVTELYIYDDGVFEGVNTVTLSRWERGFSTPSVQRMSQIISYFQLKTDRPLAFLEFMNQPNDLLCQDTITQLFKPKSMVIDLPIEQSDGLQIMSLREFPNANDLLEVNALLHVNANTSFTQVDVASFKEWMEYPNNLFTVVTYKSIFLGLFFILKLKPISFQKIIDFKMKKEDLSREDFARSDEKGSLYLLSFFSLSTDIATALFHRLYAHIIFNQESIDEIGFISSFQEAQDVAKKMGLKEYKSISKEETTIIAYKSDIYNLLIQPLALKAVFPKNRCQNP